MGLIFNEKVAEKWSLWVCKQCTNALFTLKIQQNRLLKKKNVENINTVLVISKLHLSHILTIVCWFFFFLRIYVELIVIFITSSPFSFFFFLFLTELNRFRVVFSQSQLEQAGQITCNRSHAYYDLCSVDGPTQLESITSTLYALDPINSTQQPKWLKARPYPRKWNKGAMSTVKELTLTSAPHSTQCKVTHNSPA